MSLSEEKKDTRRESESRCEDVTMCIQYRGSHVSRMASPMGPGLWSSALLLLVLLGAGGAVSQQGKWVVNIDSRTLKKPSLFFFTKTLFNSSSVHLRLVSETCNSSSPVLLNVSWYLRNSHCFKEVVSLNADNVGDYFKSTKVKEGGGSGYYVFHQYPAITCKPNLGPDMFGLNEFEMKTRLTEVTPQQRGLTRAERGVPSPRDGETSSDRRLTLGTRCPAEDGHRPGDAASRVLRAEATGAMKGRIVPSMKGSVLWVYTAPRRKLKAEGETGGRRAGNPPQRPG
ncbi:Transmembrane protein 87A [Liparis tanakae]|uniref:Transmembrane protein 87A n=1 Tax=Liparis tanakae TaxID=230148 RepID=A0A4Z2G9Y8_9TELE|nr:Transmembrane protein 87A [Liparis tanakae]